MVNVPLALDVLWDALWEDLRHNATGRPSGLNIIAKHRPEIEAVVADEARAATLARLRTAVEGLLAEPTTDIRTLNARTLFDKSKQSATQEITITAQQLRVLLPAIETEAETFIGRRVLALIDAEEGREPSEDLCSNCGYPYAGHDPRGDACPTGEGTYKYSPTAEDYAMGNMASGHEHWDVR